VDLHYHTSTRKIHERQESEIERLRVVGLGLYKLQETLKCCLYEW